MHSNWTALHAQLLRSITRPIDFDTLASLIQGSENLPTGRDPHALLDWFHRSDVPSETKNTALRDLVLIAQADADRDADFATRLLLLVLWPGLEAVRWRLRRYLRSDLGWLDAELTGRLSLGIRTLRLDRVTRIAATLLRNTERDLRRDLCAEQLRENLGDEESAVDSIRYQTANDDPAVIAAMVRALGRDGALLAAVHIGGWSQKEAAAALGLSYDAARKRCQRAMARLFETNLSQIEFGIGFSRSSAGRGADSRRASQ